MHFTAWWTCHLIDVAWGSQWLEFHTPLPVIIFKWILVIDGWGISCNIALIWMSLDFTDDQSTLVQVMAWCRQATSHYLSQYWPRSLSPYDITRPQWVNPDIQETVRNDMIRPPPSTQSLHTPWFKNRSDPKRVAQNCWQPDKLQGKHVTLKQNCGGWWQGTTRCYGICIHNNWHFKG